MCKINKEVGIELEIGKCYDVDTSHPYFLDKYGDELWARVFVYDEHEEFKVLLFGPDVTPKMRTLGTKSSKPYLLLEGVYCEIKECKEEDDDNFGYTPK